MISGCNSRIRST
ncbi:hypothetical protein YPPY64_2875, partial [Yersinia pestis PY-64]